MKTTVCREGDLEPGEMRPVPGGKLPVVLVRTLDGAYAALHSTCPHQGANLEYGCLTPLTVSDAPGHYQVAQTGGVLRCPWHSFDFDVTSGRCVSDPHLRVRTYPVHIEYGEIHVEVGPRPQPTPSDREAEPTEPGDDRC